MSGDPSQVVQFLAQNDVVCPSCGYSLRGCAQPCCPECGDALQLGLRGDSSNMLTTALRYLLWAMFVRSLVISLWYVWTIVYFPLSSSVGFTWYLRMGIGVPDEVATVVLCLVALRRMKSGEPATSLRSVATPVAWIAILTIVNLVISMTSWFW